MKVYKVVMRGGIYGDYLSSRTVIRPRFSISKAVLRYSIGKVTRPNFGYIFCFTTLSHAQSFRDKYGGAILECIGNPVSINKPMCFLSFDASDELMHKCWESASVPIKKFLDLPNGTVLMYTLRPIKEV